MIIYPAIDIRGGKCVRLVEGDFDRETVFDQDPAEAARRWEAGGATHIHVVDLDGARNGEPTSLDTI
ncbi:MAG TPA: HisA/HisF-related TIM barrel protein, partial [Thermomicrobiales bacterium]|nr:HisA/HisF-related TIM barrel protein [Thermomicrobiales bacterium]